MSAILHIRKHVLGISQVALAELTGVTQPTVSRWERGEMSPDLSALAKIREAARAKNPAFEESWFFEVPEQDNPAQPAAVA